MVLPILRDLIVFWTQCYLMLVDCRLILLQYVVERSSYYLVWFSFVNNITKFNHYLELILLNVSSFSADVMQCDPLTLPLQLSFLWPSRSVASCSATMYCRLPLFPWNSHLIPASQPFLLCGHPAILRFGFVENCSELIQPLKQYMLWPKMFSWLPSKDIK